MTQAGSAAPIAAWARRYIETFNLCLVPIDPGEKFPRGMAWNQPGGYFTDAAAAEAFWLKNPSHNMGVVLGPSGVCSLDVDDVQWTRHVLYEQLGVDLDAMALVFPTAVGNPARFRILFRVPDGLELSRHSLSWPNENDPDGSIWRAAMERAKAAKAAGDAAAEAEARAVAEAHKKFTVFELRGGLVQDVLPPSIHPGTGKPYTWRTPPSAEGLPELTPELLRIWQNWDAFKRDAEASCPWLPKPKQAAKKPAPAASQQGGGLPKVIEAFNRAHDVESLLEAHGYTRHGRKWLCPHSSTGLPGITISEGRVFSHHGSDPLANGHQNDAFDVFCILEHGGDTGAAIKAAAAVLGIDHATQRRQGSAASRQSGPAQPAPPPEAYENDVYPTDSLAAADDVITTDRRKPVVGVEAPADDWQALLKRTEGGGLQPQLMNAYLILKHAPEWKGVLAYNQFAERIEKLRAPPVVDGEPGAWADVDASKALVWLQMVWGLGMRNSAVVDEAARMVAWDNRYHPVRQWLDALPPWDGVPRLAGLMEDVFGAEPNDYTRHIGKSLLVSAVARVLRPGCKVDEMVVLEGAQGLGKSTCIAELFGPEWYLETSEAPTTKDFYVVMQGNWVVEIGEMQSFSKADINQVKMAITRRDDKYRAPYDRHGSSHPRQCIFIGTTNADTYLSDPTGARRFLPVLCDKADVSLVRFLRLEYWAEALALFRQGFRWWDYPKDIARTEQDARYVEDAWEEAIADYLDGRAPPGRYPSDQAGPLNEVTIMHLLQYALQMDIAKMNKPEQRRVADILRRMGWERGKQERVPGSTARIRPYRRPVRPAVAEAA